MAGKIFSGDGDFHLARGPVPRVTSLFCGMVVGRVYFAKSHGGKNSEFPCLQRQLADK
jgi:hypothetical protein